MISEEQWWVTQYAAEVHDHLLRKETKRLVYKAVAPQMRLRKCMVDWLAAICEKMSFCTVVQHLAVYYLDMFMDHHNIMTEHIRLVALGCLIVAVKLEEKDALIPKTSEYNALVESAYPLSEFVEMEITVMDFFKWDLLMPTAAHFLEYYSLHAIHDTDFHAGRPIPCLDQAKHYAKQYLNYFLDVSLQTHTFREHPPSLIAASCIAATRICLLLTPVWPVYLQTITKYLFLQLRFCLEAMMKILDADEVAAQPKPMIKEYEEMGSDGSPCRMSDSSSSILGSPCNNE